MKTKRLFGLTPEEVEYLRRVREVRGLWIDRAGGKIMAVENTQAAYFFKELSVLDSILSP